MSRFDPVELEVSVLRETEKAILVRTDEGKEAWIPKSQILVERTDVSPDPGEVGTLAIPQWLAEEKGIV